MYVVAEDKKQIWGICISLCRMLISVEVRDTVEQVQDCKLESLNPGDYA